RGRRLARLGVGHFRARRRSLAFRSVGPTSRQIRSAFGSRKPSASSGSAGSPPFSHHVASAIVPPSDAVRQIHVQPTRRRQRAAAAGKSAKESRAARPGFAPPASPGTGKVNESASNTSTCLFTIVFVGPRQTEYESTNGTMQATRTTQLSSSKKRRKHQATNVIA